MALDRARIEQIVIDTPRKDSLPWVRVAVQKFNYSAPSVIGEISVNAEYIMKPADEIAFEIRTVVDPILQQSITMSGYALQLMIKEFGYHWIVEKMGGEIVNGEVVL